MSSESTTRRPRGRPPLEPGADTREMALSLSAPQHKALVALAVVDRTSPQAVIRRALAHYVALRQRALEAPTPPANGAPRFPRSVTRRGF